jgi:hypothetical protein
MKSLLLLPEMFLSPILPPLLAAQEVKHLNIHEHCLAAKPKATAQMKTKAKTKTTRTVRATIAVVIVSCIFASTLILRSDFKYPVPKHFIPCFCEAHAIVAMFHLNDEMAAKFPVLNGQINEGWQAHYKRPVHIKDILQKTYAAIEELLSFRVEV